jgi:hypothetical protein
VKGAGPQRGSPARELVRSARQQSEQQWR